MCVSTSYVCLLMCLCACVCVCGVHMQFAGWMQATSVQEP